MIDEKITYLVTNYNNAKYVRECISSILSQTNPSWECLIIDDCSTDNSVEIIKEVISDNNKFRLIENIKNIGQVHSIIKLLDMAKTDIVANVDSDDAIHPETTQYVLNVFIKLQKIGLVYTNCIEYDEHLCRPISIGQAEKVPFGFASSIIFGRISSLKSFRRSVYDKTSGYDVDLKYAEDMDLMYKLEEVSLPYFLNKHLYKYRCVNNSMSRNSDHQIEMQKNHLRAKLNALSRREVQGCVYVYCIIYMYSGYYASSHKFKNNKLRKKLFQSIERLSRAMIREKIFRVIEF